MALAPLPEGVYFINIFGTGGDYVFDDKKSNLTFDVPVIFWATPWQPNFLGFTGRFEVIRRGAGCRQLWASLAVPTALPPARYPLRQLHRR